jgi:hypothetical protein
MADEIAKAVEFAVLKQKLEVLEEELDETKKTLRCLQRDRDSALRWGLIALGSGVVGLVTWIFNYFVKS